MTYVDAVAWCKESFKLHKAPSTAALCQWLKPEKSKELIELLENEHITSKLLAKGNYKPGHPDLEEELFSWFRTNAANDAILTDSMVREHARILGEKHKLQDFKASRNWVRKFKARRGIGSLVLHSKEIAAKEKVQISGEKCSVDPKVRRVLPRARTAEPRVEEPVDDDSVQGEVMSLEEARAASAALLSFLQKHNSDAEPSQKAVSEALRRMAPSRPQHEDAAASNPRPAARPAPA
jgi:hypothetical protein